MEIMFRNIYSFVKSGDEKFVCWSITCLGRRRQIQKHNCISSAHVRWLMSKKFNLFTDFKFKRTSSGDERQLDEKSPEAISAGARLSSDDLLLSEVSPLQWRRRKTPLTITTEDPRIEPTPKYRRRARISVPMKVEGEILYGVHSVTIALRRKKREIHRLYVKNPEKNRDGRRREDLESLAADYSVPIEYVDTWTLDSLATGHVHQGVCMDVGPLHLPVADEKCTENRLGRQDSEFIFPLCVVMENVKDPMNFGAVLRSAYYFGVDRVFCGTKNSCKLSPVVSKASSGAMEVIDLRAIENVHGFLQKRKENGWCIVGTSSKETAEVPLLDVLSFHIDRPVILILGNEGTGMSKGVFSLCDVLLAVHPAKHLDPGVDSLNVSAAAAILLHALMTKRPKNA